MNTKLVYVLTCAPEAYYIEQALMAVFSARHHNPDANIVLIVDDKTDALLVDKRAEILKYVSEKIVIPFEDTSKSPMYRSRWIKTSVRQLVQGDYLFIDCDTITQYSLSDIDNYNCEIGAVPESHLLVKDYCNSLYNSAKKSNETIGVDLDAEQIYFSSGVLYVKDTVNTHQLYNLWHQYWLDSEQNGIGKDQPSLAKANHDVGHIISRIPDNYNCIIFTQPPFYREAYILHITAYKNPSYLFTNKVLKYVKENGLNNEWIKDSILNPCLTLMPFDYCIKNSFFETLLLLFKGRRYFLGYSKYIDKDFDFLPHDIRIRKSVINLLSFNLYYIGISLWAIWKYFKLRHQNIKYNICSRHYEKPTK